MKYKNPEKMQKFFITASFIAITLIPTTAFAQQVGNFGELVELIVGGILNPIIVLIIALALIYFLWGMANFILHADDEQARSRGKQIMVWGIIALFVMVSVWSLVNIIGNTFL